MLKLYAYVNHDFGNYNENFNNFIYLAMADELIM